MTSKLKARLFSREFCGLAVATLIIAWAVAPLVLYAQTNDACYADTDCPDGYFCCLGSSSGWGGCCPDGNSCICYEDSAYTIPDTDGNYGQCIP
jgi:hypothetical protein